MRVLALFTTALLLSACASQPLYSPASRSGGPGYSETQLTEDRYRVSFVGQSRTPRDKVQNYALLRAAELTLDQGYDWFTVTDRTLLGDGRENEPRVVIGVGTGCGVFGCRVHDPLWHTGVRLDSQQRRDRFETSMEIRLGRGEAEDPDQVYDARELTQHLGKDILKEKTLD